MAKFFTRLFSRSSSLHGSQSSLNDTAARSKTSFSVRTSSSLENLASYHVIAKELEKNKLHKASWEGNLHKVERLARPGQINLKDQQMRTPLHLAVVKGHVQIVQYLVQENAKLDVVDNERRTPLIKAVLSGNQNPKVNYQICQILIEGGAGDFINTVDNNGRSALHYAIDFGNQHLVELFLSTDNCDPNLQDRDQMTPLHLAIKRNSSQIVQSLLSDQHEQQADPNIANRSGQTPLHLAASVGYIDIVRLLLLSNLSEPCDPTILDAQQQTAYELAKTNHQEACAKLIEEYQEKHFKPTVRRQTTTSMNEPASIRATSSISMIPAANLQHDQDETSDDSSSVTTTKPSKASPRRMKRQSDQWSDDYSPAINGSKTGIPDITGLFKTNPLQPEQTRNNTASTVNNLLMNNPLQNKTKKSTSASQQNKTTSFFGIGPVIERMDSENTLTSISVDKPVRPTLQNKPAISKLASDPKSWSDDTTTASPMKKQEPRMNSWDTSTSDDDLSIPKPNHTVTNLIKTQPLSPSTQNLTSSDSEADSVETEIRKLDMKKPTPTVGNLVNTQIGTGYKVIGLTEVQSPVSDDSSWTTSPVPFKPELPTKVTQRSKPDDSTWDDSRPLSVDLSVAEQSKGIDNLVKIMNTIVHTSRKQTSPKVIGKLLVSSMVNPNASTLSENTLHEIDHDKDYEQSWKKKQKLPHDARGSVSSTKSTFNEVQLNELRENIKKLERHQEDAYDLRRQLRDMEERKNNYEKLYKENDQTLRAIKTKLKQEQDDKERLESTTENLNRELNNIQQKLQKLENEKNLLNRRCLELEDERDQHDEKLRQTQTSSLFRDENVDKIKSRHREEMKYLSAENDDLHHRTKQLESDLELHKDTLDVTVRKKIDLEKVLEEKNYFQRELDRLKPEKELIEQEKLKYKSKYDGLQDEIRVILFDRSKLEQKLTEELQEHIQEKQRSTNDLYKYRTEIGELNMKLSDAQSRLMDLQTQNEILSTSKDPNVKSEYESVAQRSHHQDKEYNLTGPLLVQTSPLLNSNYQFRQTFPQPYRNENYLITNSHQIRSNTERVKSELDRLREDFDRLVSAYEPNQQTQLHSQIDTFRHFYEMEFRQRQLLMSKLTPETKPALTKSIPRQASALLTGNTNNNGMMSSIDLIRKHYHA